MTEELFVISAVLSTTWGAYLLATLYMYFKARTYRDRRREDLVVALRRFVVAFCIWLVCFSFVFRTLMVIAGLGEQTVGQIVFYALLGTNLVGSLFALISLRYD